MGNKGNFYIQNQREVVKICMTFYEKVWLEKSDTNRI